MVKIVKNLTLNISTFASLVFSQNVINIDYSLKAGGFEILTNFINDSVWTNVFLQHGCWCAKIADQHLLSTELGGNRPVDELDQICKDWARARRCSRAVGASCEFADFTDTYEIEFSPQGCLDSDVCLSETCQIDFSFISAIEAWRNANTAHGCLQ